MKKYIIGVDGGNTKTDYLLFDITGKLIRNTINVFFLCFSKTYI